MSIDSVATLLETLRQGRILIPPHLDQVGALGARFGEPRALAKALLERGWLTAYQINQLFQGKGARLVLGQYVLLERLGEGGMGQVFKARHQRLERAVALKVIRKDRLSHPDAIHRFQREARAAARLSHPNIVTIYDADEVGGTHFLAMEYVEGTDLSRLVKQRGPLPIAQACDYVRQAALGLQHAHEQGLVHRDIKPANLFLTAQGVVKILDMGLARLHGLAEESSQNTEAMTQEGAVMGTPDFIAPEQALDSHKADIRADLYSLGCTLYYLLAAKVPFAGGTLGEKLARQLAQDARRLEELRPDVPPGVAVIVRKLMAKRPEQRFQKPADLAAALVGFAAGGSALASSEVSETLAYSPLAEAEKNTFGTGMTVAPQFPSATYPLATVYHPPQSKLTKHWRRLIAAAGLLVLAVLLGRVMFRSGKGKEGTGEDAGWPADNLPALPPVKIGKIDWIPKELVLVLGSHRGRHWGPVRAVAYSPNGKLVASAGDDRVVCVWDANTLEDRGVLIGHTEPVLCLAFTPDSKGLLSGSADKTVRLWNIERRKEVLKLEGHTDPVVCVAISHNGKSALSGAAGGVDHAARLWSLTGESKPIHELKGHTAAIRSVTFSADGRRAYTGSSDRTVRTWDLQTGAELDRLESPTSTAFYAVSPNGQRAYSDRPGSNACVDRWDLKKGRFINVIACNMPSCIAVSHDSQRLAVGIGGGGLLVTKEAEIFETLRHFPGDFLSVAFARNGGRIVSGSADGIVRLWDVEKGEEVVQRPGHTLAVQSLALSKDGRSVLTGGADGTVRLWDLASSPHGKEVHTFKGHAGPVASVHFLPQGRALSGSSDGTARIWDLESRKELRRFEHGGHVAISSDGLRAISGGMLLWNIESGNKLKLLPFGNQFEASAGGAFCASNAQIISAVSQLPVGSVRSWGADDGKQRACFVGQPNSVVTTVASSPDGAYALAGSADGTVRFWDLTKVAGQQPTVLVGLTTSVTSVAYAPDGKTVAASAADGKVIVWDVATGKPHQEWKLPGAVNAVAFDGQGRHLATANGNGTAFILRLTSPPLSRNPAE